MGEPPYGRQRQVKVIGIGPGGADDLTVSAVRALNEVDVFIIIEKHGETDDLAAMRRDICDRHVTRGYRTVTLDDPPRDRHPVSYGREIRGWHEARSDLYERELLDNTSQGDVVGILVWGDPGLYDSTIRILDRLNERGRVSLQYSVVPGISSLSVLAARHRLVLNNIGGSIAITTGRRLLVEVARGSDNIAVLLDGHLECRKLTGSWTIWWGALLGCADDEELVSGNLADVLPQIEIARERARSTRGWVMDAYLLRRA